jgi:peptidoglycan/LPS O-acetylase OafA/YrhL
MTIWWDNLFFLFGFDENKTTIIPGGWSVGVEMYFYVFTPFIIIVYSYNKWLGRIIMGYLLFFGLRYAFLVLKDVTVLGANWYSYVAPFNNFFLFGIFLYYEFRNVKLSDFWCFGAIILAVLIFAFYPVDGNQINIVKGLNRFVFSFASVLLVLGFFLLKYQPPKWIVYPLQQFGIATYGVYLLHQLLMQFLHDYFQLTNPYCLMVVTIIGSVLLALLIYRFFEMPFIRLGKRKIFG